MMRPLLGSWKRLAVSGVAAVLFGLATLVWPQVTLWTLVVLWGAFAFVDGVTWLSATIGDPLLVNRGWVAFCGLTSIGAGVVTFLWPSITAFALLFVIATWALFIGVSRITLAVQARKQVPRAWTIAVDGAFLVLLGVVLFANPEGGAIGVTWAIGWLSVLFGSMQLWQAWAVRTETRELAGRTNDRPTEAVAA
jgi:uncharacterized membrane protein HdeD (DUF308 family)